MCDLDVLERRAADSGVVRSRMQPIPRVQEGQQLARDQQRVLAGLATAQLHVARRRVFGKAALAGIRHSHNNQRLHFPSGNGVVGAFRNAPGSSGNERRRGIEEVLAVLQNQQWIAALGVLLICGRYVDADFAVARQEAARESGMFVHPRMGRPARRRDGLRRSRCQALRLRLQRVRVSPGVVVARRRNLPRC